MLLENAASPSKNEVSDSIKKLRGTAFDLLTGPNLSAADREKMRVIFMDSGEITIGVIIGVVIAGIAADAISQEVTDIDL